MPLEVMNRHQAMSILIPFIPQSRQCIALIGIYFGFPTKSAKQVRKTDPINFG